MSAPEIRSTSADVETPAPTGAHVRPAGADGASAAALGGAVPGAAVPGFRVSGLATAYRLFDLGYEIRLDRALECLSASGPERARPTRGEARSLLIKNPPVTVALGSETLQTKSGPMAAEVSARIFDFGVVSLRLAFRTPGEMSWPELVAFGDAVEGAAGIPAACAQRIRDLMARIEPAIERPALAPVSEDYLVFRLDRLGDGSAPAVPTDHLSDASVLALLLGDSRTLSGLARSEMVPHRFSYYADDLVMLSWERALVVEPEAGNTDVEYVLEFANAQLLELRVFDALLDAELARMNARIAAARSRPSHRFPRRYASLLGELSAVLSDTTEVMERVENAFRVTDDVYLARLYAAALEQFRDRAWRGSIDRKLRILRETYQMLNAESQAARAEALEIAIIVLIAVEIVLGLVRR